MGQVKWCCPIWGGFVPVDSSAPSTVWVGGASGAPGAAIGLLLLLEVTLLQELAAAVAAAFSVQRNGAGKASFPFLPLLSPPGTE